MGMLTSVARTAATLLAAVLLAGCAASRPAIRAYLDDSADLAAYRTYGFMSELGTDRAGYSVLMSSYFKEAISRELESRGYRRAREQPDLLVNFNANVREHGVALTRPMATLGAGYYGYRAGSYQTFPGYPVEDAETEAVRYPLGTVNVDLVDARRRQLLWEGLVEGGLTPQGMKNPRAAVRSVVQQMFERFPGQVPPRA